MLRKTASNNGSQEESMNKMKNILSKINEGKTLDGLSKELGMRESTIRAIIDSMIHIGYLEEIQCRTGCKMCPTKCSSPPSSEIKMYGGRRRGWNVLDVPKRRCERCLE